MVTWKRALLVALMAFGAIACFPTIARASTLVGGLMITSTTWTTASSPYEVTSQVVVYKNAKLTIVLLAATGTNFEQHG